MSLGRKIGFFSRCVLRQILTVHVKRCLDLQEALMAEQGARGALKKAFGPEKVNKALKKEFQPKKVK